VLEQRAPRLKATATMMTMAVAAVGAAVPRREMQMATYPALEQAWAIWRPAARVSYAASELHTRTSPSK